MFFCFCFVFLSNLIRKCDLIWIWLFRDLTQLMKYGNKLIYHFYILISLINSSKDKTPVRFLEWQQLMLFLFMFTLYRIRWSPEENYIMLTVITPLNPRSHNIHYLQNHPFTNYPDEYLFINVCIYVCWLFCICIVFNIDEKLLDKPSIVVNRSHRFACYHRYHLNI